MQQSLGTVVIVVVVVAVVFALVAMSSSDKTWSEYGKGMVKDRDAPPPPPRGSRAAAREREDDIRALLEARNARRRRRGERPVDVERELERLTSRDPAAHGAPPGEPSSDRPSSPERASNPADPATDASPTGAVDASLREEVRQLVIARNHRRARAGKPPLDVDAEVERQLRRVSDL